MKNIKRILCANRGEIAIRVFRAATEIGIRTIAIFTYEDRYSLHRYKADEAYQIGEKEDPLKPYLDIEEIIRVAKENNADAIHPGYGLLSENDTFAERCIAEGIIWVGPKPDVMRALGDKLAAKKIAQQANVPIVPAFQGMIKDVQHGRKVIELLGLPVIIKAATGGGGRGMRVVRSVEDLDQAFIESQAEAKTAFGDSTVFIEKYIDDPKHIEIQILGDSHGNIVHLFERDCSVQRRYQKVVEIAPSVGLKDSTRLKLYDYAVNICKAARYENAGTVEFLVDAEENIYFIEVNTRIQVEHTITEEITGIDIVRSQLLIADGLALSNPRIGISSQADVVKHDFAIQCRITTEDPSNGFKPDYGTLIAYRSASGFGIRLDAGSAYAGAKISPFFDSLLVKVTAKGKSIEEAAERLKRALLEFRIRGVKTNIGFLLNVLDNEIFRSGKATVSLVGNTPELLVPPRWRDRSTKLLKFLADVIVNGNENVKTFDPQRSFITPEVPVYKGIPRPLGTKDRLISLGRDAFIKELKEDKRIQYTDTTFRDAHQSLLATRVRTYDLLRIAESFSHKHGGDLFSMEVWGGATFDVAMRFLLEDPWERLRLLRKAIPNVLLQMLIRGSNAVGYTSYPDNLIQKFIIEAAEGGIDVFRIFDSLNWIDAMKTSIHTVIHETDSIAEACICYTGDIMDEDRKKFDLNYYIDLAKQLEDLGVHMIAIKDMAGLLKPSAATKLIEALKSNVDVPIHLHTHDTSSIQSATYLNAVNAGVDIIDVAIGSMSGLTSQPNFNAIVEMLKGHERENVIDVKSLNEYSDYWDLTRKYYYPFETELRSGSADVYEHEIPGGQYSNLRPQARALGLEGQFAVVKQNYKVVNQLLGDIVKVTPSSKVVGDMALFMTANKLQTADIFSEAGKQLAYPDSLKALLRGDLGQIKGGFPKKLQEIVLGDEKPYTDKPNAHLEPVDFEGGFAEFKKNGSTKISMRDYISSLIYPKVYEDYINKFAEYDDLSKLPTPPFFYGLQPNEEIIVNIDQGKSILIKYHNMTEPNALGRRLVFFSLNGQMRSIEVKDNGIESNVAKNEKSTKPNEIGAPLQGNLSKIMVKVGDSVGVNDPLFVIEAMKMESTITSPIIGIVEQIHLKEKNLVEQDDKILTIKE